MSLKKRRHEANQLPRKRGNTAHSKRWRENLSASTVAKRLECAASRRFSVRWQADWIESRRCPPPHVGGYIAVVLVLAIWMRAAAFGATVPVEFSLSRAISNSQPGDTVMIQGPRIFHDHIVINKTITLVGTNSPIIDGDGVGTVLTVSAPKVMVSGIIIRNSGHDLAGFNSGIMITASEAAIRNCRVENDGFGIYLRGVDNCVIESNEVIGSKDLPSAARGNGIHLWKAQRNQILSNMIRDKRDGMYFSYADNNLIARNDVGETRFGIHYMYSNQNQLLGNSLTRNVVGATLMFSRRSVVEGNYVCANRRHGFVLKQFDSSRVANNVIAGQNRGLFVQQANQNRFEGNLIATNDIGLYLSNVSEQNVFVGNAFIRNTDQVWQPPFETEQGRHGPNAFSQKGRGNYWSDYTGADRNNDGIGDTPYHETDVFGYIIDRHPEARVFALSPAVALLRKSEEVVPLMDTTGVTDLAPLMKAPNNKLQAPEKLQALRSKIKGLNVLVSSAKAQR